MATRKTAAMTLGEREAKVAALKPQWAQDYIRQLEALTRTLHAQLTEAQAETARAIGAAHPVPAGEQVPEALSLNEAEAVIAWRAMDCLGSTSSSPGDDVVIERIRKHFAAQLPPDPRQDGEEAPPPVAPWIDPVTGQYATMTVLDGRANMEPLGSLPEGAEIRIGGFFQVHFSSHELTAGARVLVIEGDGPLIVRAVDPGTIIIARD